MKRDQLKWTKPALKVAEHLVGATLLEADMVLDEARRLAWMTSFSGMSFAEAVNRLKPPSPAIEVAQLFEGKTLVEIGALLEEVRLFVWMGNFARIPGTLFHQRLNAHLERHEKTDIPAKVH